VGWTPEQAGASVGKRLVFEPLIDNNFGISHHYDAETHRILNQTHGDMLDSHNTTILSVTWIELLPSANHTGGALENLNMTNGRLLTLHDNGVIRTAVGQTTMMGQILESFNEFKGTNGTLNPLMKKRQSSLSVDWMSFNTYGENMNEGNGYLGNMEDVEKDVVENANQAASIQFDTAFAQSDSGEFPSKFCLGASPNGQQAGQESIIVGEVYMNQWGGVDSDCDGA
jgi:hypothetical protein